MHTFPLIHAVTDLADQAVILPLVAAVLFLLLALGEARAALWWAAAMVVALGGTLIAKIVFIPCGHLLPALDVTSPSGHTAAAAAAYGSLMMLAAQATRSSTSRVAALGLGVAVVGLVALTRVALHAHTVQETLLGAAIGASAPLILMVPQPLFVRAQLVRRRWLLALPLLVLPLMVGQQLSAEHWISAFAWQGAHWLHACGA